MSDRSYAGLMPQKLPGLAWPLGARNAMCAIACVGAAAGLLATGSDATAAAIHAAGRELTMLLRFMAVVKAGFAVGLVSAAAWRMEFAARPGVTAAYAVACALMPAGAGLIWDMAHVAAGALLFHAGLLLMLATAWADRDDTGALLERLVRTPR